VQMDARKWAAAARAVAQIRALKTPRSEEMANQLQANLLLRQERVEDTISFLKGLVGADGNSSAALAALVQTQIRDGRTEDARDFLDTELQDNPANPTLRFLRAGVHLLEDQPDAAEALYRALLQEFPAADRPLQALYGMLTQQGRTEDADALIAQSIAANPQALFAQLIKAGQLERKGDIDGPRAIYETLYKAKSGNIVVANNLASSIATHDEDPENLERAYRIAQPLRDTDVPAFQDTFGWIEYRRGNFDTALAYLDPAAKGLPEDPLVQYHLGMVLHKMNRKQDALTALTRALDLAGDSALPQFNTARAVLAELDGK